MGTLRVTAYVDAKGPLFDGTAQRVVDEMRDEITKRGAQWAKDRLAQFPMDKTGRARGAFQENLRVVQRTVGYAVPAPMIRGVVWGPWLEGVTNRNTSTRFRGYRVFRQTRQELEDGELQRIADEVAQQYLPRMGGE